MSELAPMPHPGQMNSYRPGFKFILKILAGPDAGSTYLLAPPQVAIGREPSNNHIVLTDLTVSRMAAVIDFSPQEITISDLTGKARISLNGAPVLRASLKGGDQIGIGDTMMSFQVEIVPLPSAGAPPLMSSASSSASRNSSPIRSAEQKSPLFYALIGLIAIGLLYIITESPLVKKKGTRLRRETQLEQAIEVANERANEALEKRQFKSEEERTRYEEAQKHYLEGFRDYQKGIYSRAVTSFQVALGIDSQHVQARRYLKLAEKSRDEMISQLMDEGRRYREKGMFARCAAAFEKALVQIPRKSDLRYKEAEVLYRECAIKAAPPGGFQ